MIVQTTGTIQQLEITSFQYGTHVISGYAIRSKIINLDKYIGQTVTAIGQLIEGYPIEGGPEFLEIHEIKNSF
jgi:hypothetical protein